LGQLTKHTPGSTGLAAKADGNPEGKGLNGFLLDWHRTEPRGVVIKPRRQVLAEFFTSMLILSASFKYKPAVGVTNYLYYVDNEWTLSLIGPEEWSAKRRAGFAGACVLHHDMTWTIAPSDLVGEDSHVSDAIARFYDAFAETLDNDLTLEEILPFYARRMPYWQRLHASALSRSIRGTIMLGNQAATACRDWQALLPKFDASLLAHENQGNE
jgi:hypothetical protein